jgi:SAM-dependent methyltransferase
VSEIELHRKLLGDAPRNAAFHAALKKLIVPGQTTVADLGAGTGFLSFLARQLGARHCTLVEYSGALELAQQLARKNRITELSFIQAHSTEVRKPPKVDLVVTETLGNYALEENLLETAVDARRYLNKGGRILPERLRQFVAPVMSARLQDEIDIWPRVGYGLDLDAARRIGLNNMYVKTVRADELAPDSAREWDSLDFRPDAPAPPSRRERTVEWSGLRGSVQGFAVWWAAELLPGIALSTAPDAPATHWEQIYLPLLQPLQLAPRDTLALGLMSDTRPEVGVRVAWRTRQLRGGKALVALTQDSFAGRL